MLDESGFLLIPNVRKTWAPIGCTPLLRHSYSRDRISAIAVLSVSPQIRRFGFYIRMHGHNIKEPDVIMFLKYLMHHQRGPIVVIWDGSKIHRGKAVTTFLGKHKRIITYRFPAYAPEMNPIEQVWTHGKRKLSNSAHRNKQSLGAHLFRSFRKIRASQQLLRSCFEHADLPCS